MKHFLPNRLAVYCGLIPFVAVLAGERHAGGWAWDFLNALGFLALGGLVYLAVQGRNRSLGKAHQVASYSVLFILLAHIIGIISVDSVAIEYLLVGAPWYMWAGISAFLLITFALLSALPRNRPSFYVGVTGFRNWHRSIGWIAIALTAMHIYGSGFYIRNPIQYLLLAALLLPLAFSKLITGSSAVRSFSALAYTLFLLASAAALTAALNFPVDAALQMTPGVTTQ
ncbi:MAG: hypothetical protein AB8B86_15460 [Pseudomonadales bacterium]